MSQFSYQWKISTFNVLNGLLQARLRGKVDSNGCVAAFLEERLNMGLNFILSAEVCIYFAGDGQ